MEETIESIWLQVKSVIVARLQEKNQALDSDSENTIKQQILLLAKKESPVRELMWKRLLAYVRLVKSSKILPPAPPGYTDLTDDLQSMATIFKRITVYNYSVFGEHCEKLLDQLSTTNTSVEPATDGVKLSNSEAPQPSTNTATSTTSIQKEIKQ